MWCTRTAQTSVSLGEIMPQPRLHCREARRGRLRSARRLAPWSTEEAELHAACGSRGIRIKKQLRRWRSRKEQPTTCQKLSVMKQARGKAPFSMGDHAAADAPRAGLQRGTSLAGCSTDGALYGFLWLRYAAVRGTGRTNCPARSDLPPKCYMPGLMASGFPFGYDVHSVHTADVRVYGIRGIASKRGCRASRHSVPSPAS